VRARVIALGQEAAGDDGVALAVLGRLRERRLPDEVELVQAHEESALILLLETDLPVILVDAVIAGTPGEILELGPDDLATHAACPVSTHGIGVFQVIELARVLSDRISPSIRIVGVSVARPPRYERRLSQHVAAAVPRAADRVLALLGA
jgi:hydrogenase maturation protease